jgi:PAS domain S-box-containing protein
VETDAVREAAASLLLAPRQGEDDIRIQTICPLQNLGMHESAFVVCRSSTAEPLGCIAFGTGRERQACHRKIDHRDKPLCESIASLTATAFENARLYGQLIREREDLKQVRDHFRELNEKLERSVTERTRALADSEEKFRRLYLESRQTGQMYRTLLDAFPDPVVVYDIEGKPTYLNLAFTNVFGWAIEEVQGRCIDFVPVENQPETDDMIRKVHNGIQFSNQETRRVTKDGRILDVSISAAIYFDELGNAAGSIAHIRNITDHKKLEEHLLKVVKLEAVGLLAGGIAHDFNNILAGILMNVQLAEKMLGNQDRVVVNYLAGIEHATERASALTQQLLTFAKGGAPVRRSASIAQLIRDSAGFILRGSNVKCEFVLPEDLLPVEMDQGQISQVVNNLIINADQAMRDGGIINVRARNLLLTEDGLVPRLPLKPGPYVKVSVEDQGHGIPGEYLERIFDPYFSTREKGSGLGLAITFSIVSKHHGYISVESEVGIGSKFHVYLPAADISPTCLNEAESQESPVIQGRGKILVMDDEEILRNLAGELLTGFGYEVQAARNGEEAIELYEKALSEGNGFHAVIMDLTIPGGMGGRETIKKLIEIDPAAKAIVCSGYSNDPIMADYLCYGFKGVVNKPYRAQDLVKEIDRVLTDVPLPTHASTVPSTKQDEQ